MKTCPLQKVSGVGVTVSALTSVMLILGCWRQGQQLTVNIVHNTSQPLPGLLHCIGSELDKAELAQGFFRPHWETRGSDLQGHVLHSS